MVSNLAEGEKVLTVRVPADLLANAKAAARRRDEPLARVIRRALRQYVGQEPEQSDIEGAIAAASRRGGKRF